MNIPNLISLGRLLAVPLAVWLILREAYDYAFWLVVVAGMSDAVDGFIAKRFNASTALGAYLDPMADKALLMAAYVALGHAGEIESWLVILVVFRDVMIVGGVLLLNTMTHHFRVRPLLVSKINTVAQIVLVVLVLGKLGLGVGIASAGIISVMTYLVAATTFISGACYLVKWSKRAAKAEDLK